MCCCSARPASASTILEGAAGLLGGEENAERTEMTADGTILTTDAEGGVTEGRVLVDDVPVTRARGRIGLVLQEPFLFSRSSGS